MTRISKQGERRAKSPRKPRPPSQKTGPRKEIPFRVHANVTELENRFIPKLGA